jgi:hypothetical protein
MVPDSFRDAVLRAANLGDDADTTAAIAGQLAGALWGVGGKRGVPEEWLAMLALRSTIEDFADRLYELSLCDLRTGAVSPGPTAADHVVETGSAVMDLAQARMYIESVRWQFASSMPQWPHEYTVRAGRPGLDATFASFVRLIRESGEVKDWPYGSPNPRYHHTYLAIDGWEYWTMGEPVEVTTVINRAHLVDGEATERAAKTPRRDTVWTTPTPRRSSP